MYKRLELLRGQRFLTQLDEAKNFVQLKRETDRFVPRTTKRQYATDPVQIVQMKLIPYVESDKLQATAVAKSEGKQYECVILFMKTQFQETNKRPNVTFVGSDGETYYVAPISLATTNVKVRCECLDFYWRFSKWNDKRKSLYGDPPAPYQKKTDRPPVNPKQKAAVCKHLLKTMQALQEAGLVQ